MKLTEYIIRLYFYVFHDDDDFHPILTFIPYFLVELSIFAIRSSITAPYDGVPHCAMSPKNMTLRLTHWQPWDKTTYIAR